MYTYNTHTAAKAVSHSGKSHAMHNSVPLTSKEARVRHQEQHFGSSVACHSTLITYLELQTTFVCT